MDLGGGGRVGVGLGDGLSFVGEVGQLGYANVDPYGRFGGGRMGLGLGERGEEVGGEDLHHEEALRERGWFGALVCVLGCEEQEEALGARRRLGVAEQGGGCNV